MKNFLLSIIILLLFTTSYGQKCISTKCKCVKNYEKNCITNCLNAKGPVLLGTTARIKYGTPLCIVVDGVNTFLMKTYSNYTPINYNFSTTEFTKIKWDAKSDGVKTEDEKNTPVKQRKDLDNANDLLESIGFSQLKIRQNNILMTEMASYDVESDKSKDVISELIYQNKLLETKIKKAEADLEDIMKKNEDLEKQIESLKNLNEKSLAFKKEFIQFQKSFYNIDKYISLKSTLLAQIKKDSIFIEDVNNFKERSKSSFVAIYGKIKDSTHLSKKELVTKELAKIETSYIKLSAIYQQLSDLHKNKELSLSGVLKDGPNTLTFDKIKAVFETKILFEDEMNKAKIIYDNLMKSENRTKILEEVYQGIDLYDEIMNSNFETTIISENIYDDGARITPTLKNSKGKMMHQYRDFKVITYGNLKINGSAGYFLNFINDDNYSLRKKIETDSLSKTGLIEANKNTIKHSLGGLLHAYYNFEGDFDMGLSVGLSINDNANAGFYFGLSGFFTETNRLVLTSGVSFLKVKKLNTANLSLIDGNYVFTNESDTAITYDEVYKPSFFIGVSYNLF